MQGYGVGDRLAESCMAGCYDSGSALGPQQVGKASAHLLSRHLRPAQMILVAPGMSGSQRGSLGCCTACSGDAFKEVLSRLTKCSGIVVVGVGVEFTQHVSC